MIKCDNGYICLKGDTNLLFAEFELIFIDVFSTMCKKEGFEETLKVYTNMLEMFNKTMDKYKENPESDFIELYTENIIEDNKKMLKDMINDDSFIKDIIDLYNKYKRDNCD